MEQKPLDRAFAEKYLPIVYQTALTRLGNPALAKLAARRVFIKAQVAMRNGTMPAESAQEAWLTFLTQDEVASMIKQAPSIATKMDQPIKPTVSTSKTVTDAPTTRWSNSCVAASPPRTVQPAFVQIQEEYAAPRVVSHIAKPTAATAPARPASAAVHRQHVQRHAVKRDTDVQFHPRKRPMRVLFVILFSALMLINLWFIFGLLCSRGVFPKLDLGYAWFDAAIFKLFNF